METLHKRPLSNRSPCWTPVIGTVSLRRTDTVNRMDEAERHRPVVLRSCCKTAESRASLQLSPSTQTLAILVRTESSIFSSQTPYA